jgi:K+-sensing histidine kinase KdpD
MLSEARRRQGRGADVVVGFVESYGRPLTEALIRATLSLRRPGPLQIPGRPV